MKKILLFLLIPLSLNSFSENIWKIKGGLGFTEFGEYVGLHYPVSSSGTDKTQPVETTTFQLLEDKSDTSKHFGIDLTHFYDNKLGVNVGVYKDRISPKVPNRGSFNGGIFVSDQTYDTTTDWYRYEVGPVYRFENLDKTKINPFVGLNYVYTNGDRDNSNYVPYGIGGKSKVTCNGYNSRFGMDYEMEDSNIFSIEYQRVELDCDTGSFRSFQSGYSSDETMNQLMVSIGRKF